MVVQAGPTGTADVGCSARFETLVRRFEDGRLNVIVAGRARRCALVEETEGRLYFSALVRDAGGRALRAAPAASSTEVLDRFRALAGLADDAPPPEPPEGVALSYAVAGALRAARPGPSRSCWRAATRACACGWSPTSSPRPAARREHARMAARARQRQREGLDPVSAPAAPSPPARGLRAPARRRAGAAVRGRAALIWVEGPDAEGFLHGLLSNDVAGLAPGGSVPGPAARRQGPPPGRPARAPRRPGRLHRSWRRRRRPSWSWACSSSYHFSEDLDLIGPEEVELLTVAGAPEARRGWPTWPCRARSRAPSTWWSTTPPRPSRALGLPEAPAEALDMARVAAGAPLVGRGHRAPRRWCRRRASRTRRSRSRRAATWARRPWRALAVPGPGQPRPARPALACPAPPPGARGAVGRPRGGPPDQRRDDPRPGRDRPRGAAARGRAGRRGGGGGAGGPARVVELPFARRERGRRWRLTACSGRPAPPRWSEATRTLADDRTARQPATLRVAGWTDDRLGLPLRAPRGRPPRGGARAPRRRPAGRARAPGAARIRSPQGASRRPDRRGVPSEGRGTLRTCVLFLTRGDSDEPPPVRRGSADPVPGGDRRRVRAPPGRRRRPRAGEPQRADGRAARRAGRGGGARGRREPAGGRLHRRARRRGTGRPAPAGRPSSCGRDRRGSPRSSAVATRPPEGLFRRRADFTPAVPGHSVGA